MVHSKLKADTTKKPKVFKIKSFIKIKYWYTPEPEFLIWWASIYFSVILRQTLETPTKWLIKMTWLKLKNERNSDRNIEHLLQGHTGTWATVLWPKTDRHNQNIWIAKTDFYKDVYTIFNRSLLTILAIFTFLVLNSHQWWSLTKQNSLKSWKTIHQKFHNKLKSNGMVS